jgi:PhnB protein
MAITKLNPYLNFNGTAEKAIKHYESALGAKTESVQRFGDVPGDESSPENKNRIMHAVLQIGDTVIMISDCPPSMAVTAGNNVSVVLDIDDPAELDRRFAALSAGGKITMPVNNTFWGARFGMLVDAYGIPWMLNCHLKKG